MPSRKIVSISIIAVALVASVILAFGKNSSLGVRGELAKRGLLSKGPEIRLPENKNWLSDLSPLTLNPSDISSLEASSTQNLTEQVSESLIANYLSLRQSGNLDSTSALNLVNQAANFAESSSASGPKYSSADIVVSIDNSQEAVRKYGAELGNAFKINKPAKTINEILLFSVILQSQDKSRISELKEISKNYKNVSSSIINIKVPSSYASLELELLNSLEKIAGSIDELTLIFEDPLRSMQAISNYQGGYVGFTTAINKIRFKILKDDKVIYKQGESGYYLYYGI